MDLIPYDSSLAEPLTQVYNAAIAEVPHCYPVTAATFDTALIQTHERLENQQIQVATDSNSVRGFIHYARQSANKDHPQERGIIRFLYFQPGYRRVGKALLDTAEAYFHQCGLSTVRAFPASYRYPFYCFNHSFLSDHLGHIAALLGYDGYNKTRGEVFLDGINYEPVQPLAIDLSFDIKLEWKDGPGKRQDLSLYAYQGSKELGQCHSISCARFASAPKLEDWHFCDGLDAAEEVQGRGLGRHLLERARLELHKVGYRHAGISTAWQNYRAFQFYSNYGYSVADWTYEWGKDLGQTPS